MIKKYSFVFNNTNLLVAWEIYQIFGNFYKEQEDFNLVLDKEYDFLIEDPELSDCIILAGDNNSFRRLRDTSFVYYDFNLDFFLSKHQTIKEYVCSKLDLDLDINEKKIPYFANDEEVNKLICQKNNNNFSTVLFVSDQDSNHHTFDIDFVKDFLSDKINLLDMDDIDNLSTLQKVELIKKCDFVISQDLFYVTVSQALEKPNLYSQTTQFTPITIEVGITELFNPLGNYKKAELPSFFFKDAEKNRKINQKLISNSDYTELLSDEILRCFDKFKIPYRASYTNSTE